jgi:hypothetical protein
MDEHLSPEYISPNHQNEPQKHEHDEDLRRRTSEQHPVENATEI